MSSPDRVAVVEVGSGSVKLLVADRSTLDGSGPAVADEQHKTHLLRGVTNSPDGSISAEDLAETEAAFASFAQVLAETEPSAVAVVGTAVARTMKDTSPLDDLCQRVLGHPLEVISGQREADLGWRGATTGRSEAEPYALIDIGSGSTELAFDLHGASSSGSEGSSLTCFSLPIGARNVTADYLHSDPPHPAELSAALSVIELHFDDVRREAPQVVPALEGGTLIGVGAINHMARVEIGLEDPHASVDGYRLTKVNTEEVFRALATESVEDRAHNPGLAPGHVVDVVGGLCILVEFLRRHPSDELVISERDLRHGRAAELLAQSSGE